MGESAGRAGNLLTRRLRLVGHVRRDTPEGHVGAAYHYTRTPYGEIRALPWPRGTRHGGTRIGSVMA